MYRPRVGRDEPTEVDAKLSQLVEENDPDAPRRHPPGGVVRRVEGARLLLVHVPLEDMPEDVRVDLVA